MSASPTEKPKDTTQIINEPDLHEFETTNESLNFSKTPKKSPSEEIKALQEKIIWLEDAIKKKDALYQEICEENERLKEELKSAPKRDKTKNSPTVSDEEPLKKEQSKSEDEKNKQQQAQIESYKKENEELLKQISLLKQDLESLKLSQSKREEARNKEIQAQIESYKKEKEELLKQMALLKQNTEMQAQIKSYKKEKEEFLKEISVLQQNLDSLKSAQIMQEEERKNELQSLQKEKEALCRRIAMLEQSLKIKDGSIALERANTSMTIENLNKQLSEISHHLEDKIVGSLEGNDESSSVEKPKNQVNAFQIKSEDQNVGLFFLNPIMKAILYMLLAIYISFYIGYERFGNLFRKTKT